MGTNGNSNIYAIISSVVMAAAAFGAFIVSIFNARQIKTIHLIINSRFTQLLKLVRAEGVTEGRREQKESDQPTQPEQEERRP